jgi:hypothetical protein
LRREDGVRFTTVLKALVGCEQAVPEDAWFEENTQVIVVAVRPRSRARRRCGICRAAVRASMPGPADGGGATSHP